MSSGGQHRQEQRRHHRDTEDHKHRRKKADKQVVDPKYAAYQQQQQQSGHGQQQSYSSYSNTGFKSAHLEVNSLYSGDSGAIKVNAMNAPNNSTLQSDVVYPDERPLRTVQLCDKLMISIQQFLLSLVIL